MLRLTYIEPLKYLIPMIYWYELLIAISLEMMSLIMFKSTNKLMIIDGNMSNDLSNNISSPTRVASR